MADWRKRLSGALVDRDNIKFKNNRPNLTSALHRGTVIDPNLIKSMPKNKQKINIGRGSIHQPLRLNKKKYSVKDRVNTPITDNMGIGKPVDNPDTLALNLVHNKYKHYIPQDKIDAYNSFAKQLELHSRGQLLDTEFKQRLAPVISTYAQSGLIDMDLATQIADDYIAQHPNIQRRYIPRQSDLYI